MTLGSLLFGALARLPPPATRRVRVERGLSATMADGVTLVADRYVPAADERAPIVLMRCPYGRSGMWGMLARVIAEHGYQVVIQSCRGTFDSGGTFEPLRHERDDGLGTLDWLAAQPWFGGRVGMFGPSYLGYVQWAVAAGAPPCLRALAPLITASEFGSLTYPGGGFALDTLLSWVHELAHQEEGWVPRLRAALFGRRRLARAFDHLPLREADLVAVGHPVPLYRDWLDHADPGDGFWDGIDFSGRVPEVAVPATLVAGWYDIFLPRQLQDFVDLRRAGRDVRLTVGPWTHLSAGLALVGTREALRWFDAHLRDREDAARRAPVRIFVTGADRWRSLPDWPPPATGERWFVRAGGRLGRTAPRDEAPDRYRYDPASPTPAVGGTSMSGAAGARDNRRLEARADVLTYTGDPLGDDLEVIGPVTAQVHLRSSLADTDVFVRLCDVSPRGRSVNVCDGSLRLGPGRPAPDGDGVRRVDLDLWPTAHRFRRGHRVRVQVSSGAHPRIARNLGGGEPVGEATAFHVAEQEVLHDAGHPSAIILPVIGSTPEESAGSGA